MKIGIIGAGNVGKAVAASAVRAGHDVVITANSPDSAAEAASATGARAATKPEAARHGEIVILAVPASAAEAVASELQDELAGRVVIDVTNRVNPSDPGQVLDGSSMSEKLQAKLPQARVVKALNTVFSSRMASAEVDGMKPDGYLAGDDPDARAAVADFLRSIGFRPVDAGELVFARALEAMALLSITLQIRHGWPWQSAWKLIGPTGE